MANHKKFIIFALCLTLSMCQFSSFVPQYLLGVPTQFITPVSVTQSVDQYVNFQGPTFKQIFGAAAILQKIDVACIFPFILFNGKCQCPRGVSFIFGKCVGATSDDYNNPVHNDTGYPNNGTNGNGTNGNGTNGNGTNGNGTNGTAVECPLRKINLFAKTDDIEDLAFISRTYDGTKNNKKVQSWGSKGSLLERRAPSSYVDGVRRPINNLPSPRVISNTIGSQSNPFRKSRVNATIAFTLFGQFIDHDIDLTFSQRSTPNTTAQTMHIQIPAGDKFFTNQTQIDFTRSQFVQEPGQVRRHRNFITSWIDGSQIYGSDNQTNCALRTFTQGKLKISGTKEQEFLPLFNNFFRAGDVRAIENAVLATYHTIFLREHNRLCDKILQKNPQFNDQTVFQIARNYVIGLLQKIYLKDFVPILLGNAYDRIVGPFTSYKQNVNPNIPTEFSTAAFRLGHPLLINKIPAIDDNGKVYEEYALNDLFFKQSVITHQFITDIIRGASRTVTKDKSPQLVDDVRNLLVLDPNNRQVKLDLFSLNIQRGRDHGLPTYNAARVAYGLPKINTFQELLPMIDLSIAKKLKTVYGHPDNIQLWIGVIAEKPLMNGILGQLGARIVGQTFRNLRDGDRFWYENAYPASVIAQIDATELGDICRRNGGASDLSSNIFQFYGY